MLTTFFRKIRKSLIDSSSARKYILYAVGEILLVMIGILLGFQVNNLNEWRKDRYVESKYLNSLSTELVLDTAYYLDKIEMLSELSKQYKLFIGKMYLEQKDISDYKEQWKNIDFPPNELTIYNSTYFELINAGDVKIISDYKLRNFILCYYKRFEEINKHITEYDGVVVELAFSCT